MSSDFKKGDKFIIELGDRQLDEFEIAGTEYYIKIYLLKQLTPYKPENIPSVQPERKMGHWKRYNTYHGDDTSGFLDPDWRCSECGGQANINNWFMYDLTDFCPNCGAEMRGGQDETNRC